MMAFGPLRSVFNARELDGFVDIMAERGIRMRKGVDEYIERMTGGDESGSDSEDLDGSEDEIEREARQRRLLMPY
jgi:hypothetical protein